MTDTPGGYELLDAGVRRRLERFGAVIVDRPAPMADGFRLAPESWPTADLRFDAGAGWTGPGSSTSDWQVEVAGLTLELRPTASGGLGLYPEHAANLAWLAAQVAALPPPASAPPASAPADAAARADPGAEAPHALNLFAHTGLATLALARAGAAVTHVDAARSAVAWARRNALLSGLADRPVRWIVDDAAAFVARESRRGRRYEGIVLDPPAFGRAGRREWRLEADLPNLLAACRSIATPEAFVLLTAHSESADGRSLGEMLRTAFQATPADIEVAPLRIQASTGASLELGWAARLGGRAAQRRFRGSQPDRFQPQQR